MATKKTLFKKKAPAKKAPVDVPVSAPRPKTKGSRPTLAEAKKIAKAAISRKDAAQPGAVEDADPGLVYYYFDALEVDEARQIKLRLLLEGRGYWKADGGEFVQGVPHAEIWATYREVAAQLRAETRRRHDALKKKVGAGKR